jgi:hypothetical protein
LESNDDDEYSVCGNTATLSLVVLVG